MTRSPSIDIARGIGILLVVFGHNWLVLHDKGEAYRVIVSFHIPLFVFLSGVFLHPDRSFSSVVRSRADALLKPYFFVMACIGLVTVLRHPPSALPYFTLM